MYRGSNIMGQVLTMGIVKSVTEQENTTNHVLGDPEDMNKEFEVLTYNGVSDTEVGTTTFVEGTRVLVVGKLRSLSDRHGMFVVLFGLIFDMLDIYY
ncbi:hypothetical protein OESDEN_01218 [Oesophagostomum dentatum]|uniref:Uncharacterized protein n=1 Tax=Oesophagostomum dentatum TaxID=61180 RepID=A0A0B1TNF5_OESDE|nr:hypothetical protein OESDEN_01218 [Oesophagostomum dentatum]